jgi:hypothetical protein
MGMGVEVGVGVVVLVLVFGAFSFFVKSGEKLLTLGMC